MENNLTYIDEEAFKHNQQEIKRKISKIKETLEQLIQANEHSEKNQSLPNNQLLNLLELQKQILELPKILQQKYKLDCQQLAFSFVQYMLSKQNQVMVKDKHNQTTFQGKPTFFLPQSDLFEFRKIFELVAFKKVLAKLQFKSSPFCKKYLRQAGTNFKAIIQKKMVNDSCVGCNSFFYKYHPIQTTINFKTIPIYFAYNQNREIKYSMNSNSLKAPPSKLRVDLLKLKSQEHKQINYKLNFLKLIESILNRNGGYLIIGCYKMSAFSNNQLLPQLQQNLGNCSSLKEIHFVIGELLTQQERKEIQKNIQRIIYDIQPQVDIRKQIQVRFVPVQQSPFNNGYFISNFFKHQQTKKRYVILIAVKPSANIYKIVGPYQQSAQQLTQGDLINNQQYLEQMNVFLPRKESRQKSHRSSQLNSQLDQELQQLLQKGSSARFFDGHSCKFGSNYE